MGGNSGSTEASAAWSQAAVEKRLIGEMNLCTGFINKEPITLIVNVIGSNVIRSVPAGKQMERNISLTRLNEFQAPGAVDFKCRKEPS